MGKAIGKATALCKAPPGDRDAPYARHARGATSPVRFVQPQYSAELKVSTGMGLTQQFRNGGFAVMTVSS